MFDLSGFTSWFQALALSILAIYTIVYMLDTFLWKKRYMQGFIGIFLIGFTGFMIAFPERALTAGLWLAEIINFG